MLRRTPTKNRLTQEVANSRISAAVAMKTNKSHGITLADIRRRPQKSIATTTSTSRHLYFHNSAKHRKNYVPYVKQTQQQQQQKQQQQQQQQQQRLPSEQFIMKLFDRSLDLSKYSENTPLYPICRAWMLNQPRNPNLKNYRTKRPPSPPVMKRKHSSSGAATTAIANLMKQIRNGEVKVINEMPLPADTDFPKIPTHQFLTNNADTTVATSALNNDDNKKWENMSREEMLAMNKRRWKLVKSNWQTHQSLYKQKQHRMNSLLLNCLYKPYVVEAIATTTTTTSL